MKAKVYYRTVAYQPHACYQCGMYLIKTTVSVPTPWKKLYLEELIG
ncbi:MAG TPA: hypothetical protein VIK63_03930 [Haloplasmataceae bacterium]